MYFNISLDLSLASGGISRSSMLVPVRWTIQQTLACAEVATLVALSLTDT
jgi:hypothetical protein